MTSKPKTPLDLELNLFENSFASKDLLHQQPRAPEQNGAPAAPGSSHTTQDSNLSLHTTSSNGSSGHLDASAAAADSGKSATAGASAAGSATNEPDDTSSNGSNKHNLRISNFQGLSADRPLGLTPPLFTPGGRRLPPIHLSPGGMGSPETPGTSMWSSLLNATGSNPPPAENTAHYAHPGLNPYFNSMRKSGLVPTESNLRSGLTPGLMNHGNGYFNLSESLGNGQMTPGLQTLLGLNANAPLPDGQAPAPAAPAASQPAASQAAPAGPANYPNPAAGPGPVPGSTAAKEPEPKAKRTAVKRESETPETKQPARKAAKTKAEKKAKEEPVSQASSPDDGDKRKQFLERNRVAASKCRQRKKQLFTKMESELSFYSNGFRELSGQVKSLRNHLTVMKNVLQTQKDNPAVANAVGGFQQLQNILSQAEFLTHSTTNAEANLSSIPSTIPTTLNPADHMAKEALMDSNGPLQNNQLQNNQLQNNQLQNNQLQNNHLQNNQLQNGPMPNAAMGSGGPMQNIGMVMNPTESARSGAASRGGEAMGFRDHPVDDGPLQYHNTLAKHYTPDGVEHGMDDVHSGRDNLRAINSTSNLQNVKMHTEGYDLRPIASMADMQSHGSGDMPKQFHLG